MITAGSRLLTIGADDVFRLAAFLLSVSSGSIMVAELLGAPLMVIALALLFRLLLRRRLVDAAREQAERGIVGKMDGHAEMDMSVTGGPLLRRILSAKGKTAISHYFVMDWVSIWKDIALGLLFSGFIAEFVPSSFWAGLFLTGHPTLARLWGTVRGPARCGGLVRLLRRQHPARRGALERGHQLRRLIAFIFADLIVLPVLNIYRKYYGLKMATFLFATFYAAISVAALVVEYVFVVLGLAPHARRAVVLEPSVRWNYATVLDIIFGALALALLVRFFRTGGPEMVRRMDHPREAPAR